MSDPLFPLGEDQRRRNRRLRPRSESSSPRDRPASLPRREHSGSTSEEEDAPSATGSVVLSVPSRHASTHTNGLAEQKHPNRQQQPAAKGGKRARTATPATAAWAIPSSSRCGVCGRLACSCGGHHRLDREAVKQKLETLKMNTPYERAKLLRSTGDLRSDEARRRQRLVDAWENAFLQLQAQELGERVVVSLVQKERAQRASLVREEQKQRAFTGCVVDRYAVLSALAVHEREGRLAVTATESEERLRLRTHLQILNELSGVAHKEVCARRTIEFNEGAAWDGVVRGMANAREQMHLRGLQQIDLWKQCENARDGVAREWAAQFDRIVAMSAVHASWIGDQLHRRVLFTESAMRSAREIEKEEAAIRRGMQDEMSEDAQLVVERQRVFARSCLSLVRMETTARQGIVEEMTSSYHGIFLEFQEAAEEVAETEKLKVRRRDAEAHAAVAHLRTIIQEEAGEFAALLSQELRERDQRYEWMRSKEAERARMVQCSLAEADAVVREEEEARRELSRLMQQGEMEVEERLAQRSRRCRDLWTAVVALKDGTSKEEHEARFRLISHMAEHEESIRRWCEYKVKAVTAFLAAEDDARGQLYYAEENAWEMLRMSLADGVASIEKHQQEQQEALANLLRACAAAGESITAEERESFAALQFLRALERERAVAAEHHRVQLEFQLREGQSRAWIAQEESGARSAVAAAMALAQRFLDEEARQLLHARMAEVAAAERSARTVIIRAIEEGYEALYYQERDAQLLAIAAEEERIVAELRAREVCLAEDSRLYPTVEAGEALIIVAEDATGVAEGHRRLDPTATTHAASSATSSNALKAQLVLQALGIAQADDTAVPLDPRAVDYLVAVVDGLDTRRAEARDRLGVLEKTAKDAGRRAAQQEAIYASEREKRDANAARLERDTEERESRVQNDKAERQRGAQQIETERRRLDDVLAQLEERRAELDRLKGSINKQFGRA